MRESFVRLPAPPVHDLPLRPFCLIRAILGNPLTVWSRVHFEELVVASRTPLGERILVNDPAAIRRVLVDAAANYPKDGLQQRILLRTTGRSLFSAKGEDWAWQRRVLAPLFGPTALAAYLPGMNAASAQVADRLAAGPAQVDIAAQMSQATVDLLGHTLFPGGFSEETFAIARSLRRFTRTAGAVGITDVIGLPPWIPGVHRLMGLETTYRIRQRARRVIECNPQGIVAALLGAEDPSTGRRFSRREVEDMVSTFIGAGSDTTASALTMALYLLGRFPAVRDEVEREVDAVLGDDAPSTAVQVQKLEFTRAVLDETLRLYPPAPLLGRMARKADELAGHPVPKGAVILISPWVLHRHRRLWSNPEAFDPRRFLGAAAASIPRCAYLPFGAGPRACIGTAFALQEALVLLAHIVRRIRLHPVGGDLPELGHWVTLQTKDGLPMRIERR